MPVAAGGFDLPRASPTILAPQGPVSAAHFLQTPELFVLTDLGAHKLVAVPVAVTDLPLEPYVCPSRGDLAPVVGPFPGRPGGLMGLTALQVFPLLGQYLGQLLVKGYRLY